MTADDIERDLYDDIIDLQNQIAALQRVVGTLIERVRRLEEDCEAGEHAP